MEEDGYNDDSPYCGAIKEFVFYLRDKYSDDEEFIQAIIECCGDDAYGWGLHQIEDEDLFEYAREKMVETLESEYYDEGDIERYLNCDELPK